MNDFKVPITKVLEVKDHPNAHSLSFITVYGFQVIATKNKYKVGDLILYAPIDSILPQELEDKLFPVESKVKLHSHRVRQIKIRGAVSQGMLIDLGDIIEFLDLDKAKNLSEGDDLSLDLNITKYEPPVAGPSTTLKKGNYRKRNDHPLFHQYNSVNNIKWFPDIFPNGEEVVITEKIHGTNSRLGLLPFIGDTWYKKLISFLGLASKTYRAYGSNRVEISASSNYKGYYDKDLYGETFKKIKAFDKVRLGETIYGEIYGPGIQKGYEYGLTELNFILFDVKILQPDGKQKWLNPEDVEAYGKERGFDTVPILYAGPFNKEIAEKLSKGPSVICSKEKVREGVVVKARYEYDEEGNKRAYKLINEEYLNRDNSDNH